MKKDGWEICIRFYKELGTWEFTLRRFTYGFEEFYPMHWESKDEAVAELEWLEARG